MDEQHKQELLILAAVAAAVAMEQPQAYMVVKVVQVL
jgi:hypothetical protein